MIRIITTTIALTLATPALSQENIIPGVRLGQTEAEAQAVFQGRRSEIRGGKQGAALLLRNGDHVGVCNGRVFSISRKIGSDLHAFADTVLDQTNRLGDPAMTPRHIRTADGEISTLGAEWALSGGRVYIVSMLYSGSQMDVTESVSQLGGDC
jgi:hypothetical protein